MIAQSLVPHDGAQTPLSRERQETTVGCGKTCNRICSRLAERISDWLSPMLANSKRNKALHHDIQFTSVATASVHREPIKDARMSRHARQTFFKYNEMKKTGCKSNLSKLIISVKSVYMPNKSNLKHCLNRLVVACQINFPFNNDVPDFCAFACGKKLKSLFYAFHKKMFLT